MLDQRLTNAGIEVISHSPHIVPGESGYIEKDAALHVGAREDAPVRSIPMLDQRLINAAIGVISHSPDIVCRDGGYGIQLAKSPDVGTRNDAPPSTVPMFDQRLQRVIDVRTISDGPDITLGESCYSIQLA